MTPSSGISLSIDLEIGEKEIQTWPELLQQAEEFGVSIRLAACTPGHVKVWSVSIPILYRPYPPSTDTLPVL